MKQILILFLLSKSVCSAQIDYLYSTSIRNIHWGQIDSVVETHYVKLDNKSPRVIDKKNPKEFVLSGESHTFYKAKIIKIKRIYENAYLRTEDDEMRKTVFNNEGLLIELDVSNSRSRSLETDCYSYDENDRIISIVRTGNVYSQLVTRDSIFVDTLLLANYYDDGALNTLFSYSPLIRDESYYTSERKNDSIYYYRVQDRSELGKMEVAAGHQKNLMRQDFPTKKEWISTAFYDPLKNSYSIRTKDRASYFLNGTKIYHKSTTTGKVYFDLSTIPIKNKYDPSSKYKFKYNQRGDIIQIMEHNSRVDHLYKVIEFEIFYPE